MRSRSNKKRIRWNMYRIIGLISLIMNALFLLGILILNVLPTKYALIILVGLIIIDIIIFFFSFVKRPKTKKWKKIYFVSTILYFLISLIGSIFLFRTILFMDNLVGGDYKTENYSVIVLKESSYNQIEDIKGKTVGHLSDEEKDILELKKHLDKKVKINYKEYVDSLSLENDLLNKSIDAIVIEDSYKDILAEYNESFNDITKVIYTFSIKVKADDITKNVNVVKEPFSIYISGIDTYGTISSVSRSDVNIVATINPETNQVLLISIPRDYYVKLHGTTGYNDKLTHAGIYGIDMSVKTIEDLLGIDINYYIKVNFTSVIDIVNALDGIDVNSEYTFRSYSGYYFKAGYNHMNGEQALDFARTRKAFASGDRQRGKNQEAVIEALIKKFSSANIIKNYTSLLNSLEGKFQTNMSTKQITSLAKYQLDKMPEWNVTSISLDGSDGNNYTYSFSGSTAYVMIPNESSIKAAQEALQEILGGEVRETTFNRSSIKEPTKKSTSSTTESNSTVTETATLKLSNNDITMKVGETTKLSAVLTGSNSSLIWSSADQTVASVSDGTVTAIGPGTTNIKVTSGELSATCIVRVVANSTNNKNTDNENTTLEDVTGLGGLDTSNTSGENTYNNGENE